MKDKDSRNKVFIFMPDWWGQFSLYRSENRNDLRLDRIVATIVIKILLSLAGLGFVLPLIINWFK